MHACIWYILVRRLALSGDLDFPGEISTLALKFIQSLVGLLAEQFLSLVIIAVQAVVANSAGFPVDRFASGLALELGLGGEADLVSRDLAVGQIAIAVLFKFLAVSSEGLTSFRFVMNLVTVS